MSHLMLAPPQVDQTQSKLISFLIESVGRLCRRQRITVKQTLMLQIQSMGEEKKKMTAWTRRQQVQEAYRTCRENSFCIRSWETFKNSIHFFLWTDFIILPNRFWQKKQKGGLLQRPTIWGMTAKKQKQKPKKTINNILLINNWPVFNLWKLKIQ